VHSAPGFNALREKLRIDSNVRARIDNDGALAKMAGNEMAFGAVCIAFESAIERPIDWKSNPVELISDSAAEAG